jgi:hypothetical protein
MVSTVELPVVELTNSPLSAALGGTEPAGVAGRPRCGDVDDEDRASQS